MVGIEGLMKFKYSLSGHLNNDDNLRGGGVIQNIIRPCVAF